MKTAVVTGTSYGLGKSIATLLLEHDYKVYGVSRTESSTKDSNFVWIKADLAKDLDLENIKSTIQEEKIDLLVNNAGMAFLELTTEFSDKGFEEIFTLNFKVPIKLTNLLLGKLKSNLVVNISSDSDRFADKGLGLYSSTKAALNIFFDTLTLENPSIKVFNMLCSTIDTPLTRSLNFEGFNDEASFAQYMKPDEVALGIYEFIENEKTYANGTRAIILSNNLQSEAEDPEILYSYNVDTKKTQRLK